jgi:hypothetical protein
MSRFFGFAGIVALAVTFFGAQADKPQIDAPTPAVGQESIAAESVGAAPDKIGTETAPVVVPVSAPAAEPVIRVPGCVCSDCKKEPCECGVSHGANPTASGCQCDHSRTPYYYSGRDNKWYPTRLFTAEEAEAENARIANMKASEPAAAASPSASAPVVPCVVPTANVVPCRNCRKEVNTTDTYCRGCGVMYPGTQPVRAEVQTTQQVFRTVPVQGGCANGQCGVGILQQPRLFRRGR